MTLYASTRQISRRTRNLRLSRQLTQQQLAELSGIDQRQLSRIERAEAQSISLADFLRLSEALGVDPTTLALEGDMRFKQASQVEVTVPTGTVLDSTWPGEGAWAGTLLMAVGENAAARLVECAAAAGTEAELVDGLDGIVESRAELLILDWGQRSVSRSLIELIFGLVKGQQLRLWLVLPPASTPQHKLSVVGRTQLTDYADAVLGFDEAGAQRLLKNRYGPLAASDQLQPVAAV